MHHRTRGGSRETEVKELTVIPMGALPVVAVMTATPVGKQPSAARKARVSKVMTSLSGVNRLRSPNLKVRRGERWREAFELSYNFPGPPVGGLLTVWRSRPNR